MSVGAFRGLVYEEPVAGSIANLVTEPYDKISADMKADYEGRSPYNVVRLIRGESGPNDDAWHGGAAKRLSTWRAAGALVREPTPVLYVYRQTFTTPDGVSFQRTATVGAFDMSRRDRVLHHERTHSGPRVDRRRLLDATGVHFGLIFLLRHSGPSVDAAVYDAARPMAEVEDAHGTIHRVSRLTDVDAIHAVENAHAESSYVIADGHHRFTVASAYADESDHPAAGQCLVSVVDVDDPGLAVLPTHRCLSDLPDERRRDLEAAIEAAAVKKLPADIDVETFLAEIASIADGDAVSGQVVYGALTKQASWVVKNGADVALPDARALDTSDLDSRFVAKALDGLDPELHLSYHRDARPVAADVRRGRADALFLPSAIPARTVVDVAEAGGVMPQKSTDFFPKMLTGFVVLDTAART